MRLTYDPADEPDHPAERRWREFKRKLDDKPGGWPLYLGIMYLAAAVGNVAGAVWSMSIPIWLVFGGLGVVLVGYSIVQRGVIG